MKPYILALFACSVVAVGQSKPMNCEPDQIVSHDNGKEACVKNPHVKFYLQPCRAGDSSGYWNLEDAQNNRLRCMHVPKPHKAKTPAKPKEKPLHWEGGGDPMPSGFVEWDVKLQDPQTPAKPKLHADAMDDIIPAGTTWTPTQHPVRAIQSTEDFVDDKVKPSDLSATTEALAPTKWSCTTDATENRVVIVCEKGSK